MTFANLRGSVIAQGGIVFPQQHKLFLCTTFMIKQGKILVQPLKNIQGMHLFITFGSKSHLQLLCRVRSRHLEAEEEGGSKTRHRGKQIKIANKDCGHDCLLLVNSLGCEHEVKLMPISTTPEISST